METGTPKDNKYVFGKQSLRMLEGRERLLLYHGIGWKALPRSACNGSSTCAGAAKR